MNIRLPKELDEFVNELVQRGLYDHPDLAIADALRLLKQQYELEKVRLEELRKFTAVGVGQADRGELIDGEEVFRKLRMNADTGAERP
jgi:antitoxin ParD1/3/4